MGRYTKCPMYSVLLLGCTEIYDSFVAVSIKFSKNYIQRAGHDVKKCSSIFVASNALSGQI